MDCKKRPISDLEGNAERALVKIKQSQFYRFPIYIDKIISLFKDIHDHVYKSIKSNPQFIFDVSEYTKRLKSVFNIKGLSQNVLSRKSFLNTLSYKISRLPLIFPWLKKYGSMCMIRLIMFPEILDDLCTIEPEKVKSVKYMRPVSGFTFNDYENLFNKNISYI